MERRVYVLVGVTLLLALIACGSLGRLLPNRTSATAQAAPTATASPPPTATPPPALDGTTPSVQDVLRAEESWLNTLYEHASQSVVHITSRSYTYDFFFRAVPQEGTGTGFVWDDAGHIVTNYHVVENAQELEVTLADGTQVTGEVIGADPPNDLAVLRLQDLPSDVSLTPLPIGTSDNLIVGQRVAAIGNPFGFDRTLTTGVISAVERVIQSDSGSFIGEVIQTDAAINPGNSGGPLLDIEGRVIGVNTAIISPSGANAGIGFAIPARTVKRVVPALIEEGRYPHAWLGAEFYPMRPALAQALRDADIQVPDEGLLVVQVYRGGPADDAGLRAGDRRVRIGNLTLPVGGDVITAIDGQTITSSKDLTLLLENDYQAGDTVTVQYQRDGEEHTADMTLATRPAN